MSTSTMLGRIPCARQATSSKSPVGRIPRESSLIGFRCRKQFAVHGASDCVVSDAASTNALSRDVSDTSDNAFRWGTECGQRAPSLVFVNGEVAVRRGEAAMNSHWKRAMAMAMLVGLTCACTSMRDSSRYWSDTVAQDASISATALGKTAADRDRNHSRR